MRLLNSELLKAKRVCFSRFVQTLTGDKVDVGEALRWLRRANELLDHPNAVLYNTERERMIIIKRVKDLHNLALHQCLSGNMTDSDYGEWVDLMIACRPMDLDPRDDMAPDIGDMSDLMDDGNWQKVGESKIGGVSHVKS